jgi:hypothetical protein
LGLDWKDLIKESSLEQERSGEGKISKGQEFEFNNLRDKYLVCGINKERKFRVRIKCEGEGEFHVSYVFYIAKSFKN